MEQRTLTLTKEEDHRAVVLDVARCGGRTNKEIAQALGLSVRQVQRLKKALREEGPVGLAHGNRGQDPGNAFPEELIERVVELYRTNYTGSGFSHFHEKLTEVEHIQMSVRSVRRILREAGFESPKKRRPTKHRSRRQRRGSEGAMLQLDGSTHDWLEGRGPKLCLVGAIDDATGKVAGAVFRHCEDAHGYFLMMRQVLTKHGVPETVYHDRHGIFERDPKEEEAIWEQLEGRRAPTQFGRLMQELGVRQISANSPQAKGRVERLWGTLQDRLVSELRIANICSIEDANRVLGTVIAEHNRRFCRKPDDPISVYRKVDKGMDLNSVFCFKYRRKVAKDNTVCFEGNPIQIGPGPGNSSYAGCLVELQERFDGSLHIYYKGCCIAKTLAPAEPPDVIRVKRGNGKYTEECPWTAPRAVIAEKPQTQRQDEPCSGKSHKPSPTHPWRRPWGDKIAGRRG